MILKFNNIISILSEAYAYYWYLSQWIFLVSLRNQIFFLPIFQSSFGTTCNRSVCQFHAYASCAGVATEASYYVVSLLRWPWKLPRASTAPAPGGDIRSSTSHHPHHPAIFIPRISVSRLDATNSLWCQENRVQRRITVSGGHAGIRSNLATQIVRFPETYGLINPSPVSRITLILH